MKAFVIEVPMMAQLVVKAKDEAAAKKIANETTWSDWEIEPRESSPRYDIEEVDPADYFDADDDGEVNT